MVNLVKAIESSSLESDAVKMKSLKKQLRSKDSDINKLRQSTMRPDRMIAPIHAAVGSGSVEILQLVLDTSNVDLGSLAVFGERRGGEKVAKFGVLDVALVTTPPSIEIVALLLEHVEELSMVVGFEPGMGSIPFCLGYAMDEEYWDILDLLLTKADLVKIDTFSPFYCLAYAILKNKLCVFTHLL